MSENISGAEYSLSKIFSADFDYVVSSYQCSYVWSVNQASELFNNLYNLYELGGDDAHLLGSVTLIKNEEVDFTEVIDGQQKLITLTILLALITSSIKIETCTEFLSYIQKYEKDSQDIKIKPKIKLKERDNLFFTKYIQSFNFEELMTIDPLVLDNEFQRHIQANCDLLQDKLKVFHGNVLKLYKFYFFLIHNCFVFFIYTTHQVAAMKVLALANNKALNLLPLDIIKVEIIGMISTEKHVKFINQWEKLEKKLGRNCFNKLLGYINFIYKKKSDREILLADFKDNVINMVSAPEHIVEEILLPYTEAYLVIKSQTYISISHAKEINYLLKWLNKINHFDWFPVAILFLTQKKDEPEYVFWFFTRLERLAVYLHICEKNINERIERYAQVIFSLRESHSFHNPSSKVELSENEINEMKNYLKWEDI